MYKIEDMKFLNMKTREVYSTSARRGSESHDIFEIEDELSVEEKIKFIDEIEDGLATYLLGVINKWEEEQESLPRDKYGINVNTNSKKYWIKRNDPRGRFSLFVESLGNYWFLDSNYKGLCSVVKSPYGKVSLYEGESIVNSWFHDLCKKLYRLENQYLRTIDPKKIKTDKIIKYVHEFGVLDNHILNEIYWNNLEIEDEEKLDFFIEKYEQLKALKESIMKEINN